MRTHPVYVKEQILVVPLIHAKSKIWLLCWITFGKNLFSVYVELMINSRIKDACQSPLTISKSGQSIMCTICLWDLAYPSTSQTSPSPQLQHPPSSGPYIISTTKNRDLRTEPDTENSYPSSYIYVQELETPLQLFFWEPFTCYQAELHWQNLLSSKKITSSFGFPL